MRRLLRLKWLCIRLGQIEAKWFAEQFNVHGQGSCKGLDEGEATKRDSLSIAP
jgi:hypothetical protein